MTGLRDAALDDLDAIAALERQIFGVDAWSSESVRAELAEPGRVLAIQGSEDRARGIAGYAILSIVGPTAELRRIAVAPDMRRNGLGALLLTAVLARASVSGCDELFLEVASPNLEARALYLGAGFDLVGSRPRYYRNGDDAVVYRRSLDDGA